MLAEASLAKPGRAQRILHWSDCAQRRTARSVVTQEAHCSAPTLRAAVQMVEAQLALKDKQAPGMSTLLYVLTGCGRGHLTSLAHPKALGDLLEAAIGAVFLDTGKSLSATYPVRAACMRLEPKRLRCSESSPLVACLRSLLSLCKQHDAMLASSTHAQVCVA